MHKEQNMSDTILTVAGIKVLGDIEGSGYQKLKENVEKTTQSVAQVRTKQEDFWSALSKDGIISRTEKKQLKKEYEGINQTHTALMAEARRKGCDDTEQVLNYDQAFKDLRDYLYITLKLFDDMTADTPVESSEVFNSYYNNYYYWLQNAQSRVNIGDPGSIRELPSLIVEGYDGEVALYENQFYRYVQSDHTWYNIEVASKLGEYQGVLTASPPQVPNQYFLVGPQGIVSDTLLFDVDTRAIEDDAWTDENGELIYINYGFEAGYIYYWSENNEYVKVEDKNNWRYIIAMNDMITCGYPISPELYAFITKNVADEISDKVKGDVKQELPSYLGKRTAKPTDPNDGDWLIWNTTSTSLFTKGHLYMYQEATVSWIELNPASEDGKIQDMFSRALKDILEVNPTETGYFAAVFARALYSNTAVINQLSVQQLELESTGYMKSKGYVAGSKGWMINGSGNAEFTSVTIGGYATDSQLSEVSEAASDAASAASAAQTTASNAATAAGNAQTAADAAGSAASAAASEAYTAKEAAANTSSLLSRISKTSDDGATTRILGEVYLDPNDKSQESWAFRTAGFDPATSTSGFGITKNGNVYANNGQFNGILKIGKQDVVQEKFIEGTSITNGTIQSYNAWLSGTFQLKDHAVIQQNVVSFQAALAASFWRYKGESLGDMTLFEKIETNLLPAKKTTAPMMANGFIRISYNQGAVRIRENINVIGIGYFDGTYNRINIAGYRDADTISVLIANDDTVRFSINSATPYTASIEGLYINTNIQRTFMPY